MPGEAMGLDRISRVDLAATLFGGGGAKTLALLKAAWPRAVGPALAGRTELLALEGSTLRVRVPDQGWRRVLHRMQPQILARLAEVAGSLTPRRLGFVEGPVVAPLPPPVNDVPTPHAAGHVPPSVAAEAAAIPDPEIRERFLQTAARYLDRVPRGE